jgi:hypothetical protein
LSLFLWNTQKGATAEQPLSSSALTAECSCRAIDCGVSSLGIKVNNQIGFFCQNKQIERIYTFLNIVMPSKQNFIC